MSTLSQDATFKGILCAATGFGLFAAGDSIFKYLSDYYSVYNLILYNGICLVAILLLASLRVGGLKQTVKSPYKKLHFLRGFLMFCQLSLIIYAFNNLPMATVYAIIFIAPILLSILSIPILKDTVDKKHWLIIFTGFAGVLIILRPGLMPIDMPLMAVLLSALFFALSNLIIKFIPSKDEPVLAWGILPEVPIILCGIAISAITGFTIPQIEHLGLLLLGGILSAIAMIAISYGFIYAKVSVAAPFHYTQMIWGIVLGYFLFGDIPDKWTLIGAAIIIASGIWLIRHESSKAKSTVLEHAMEQTASHPEHIPSEK